MESEDSDDDQRPLHSDVKRLHGPRFRRPLRWWELMLPAGIWILAGKILLVGARAVGRSGLRLPYVVFSLVRLSGRSSRIGFRVWRHLGGKWR